MMYHLTLPMRLIGRCTLSRAGRRRASKYSTATSDTSDPQPCSPEEQNISKLLDDAVVDSYTEDKARVKTHPNDTSILMFPGQGTLKVGSIKPYLQFPVVKDMFNVANKILKYDLLRLCMEGPQKKLNLTMYNQPATVVASLAALEKLQEERPYALETCIGAVGYSLGELTALIFSGAIDFESGIRLAGIRGAAMQQAASQVPQGMLFAFCSAQADVSAMCKAAKTWAEDLGVADPVCQVAIYMYTQGKVFAGNEEALQYIETNGRNFGLRRMQRVGVSGAFHTQLMQPALNSFKKALDSVVIEDPRVNVYSNVTTKPYKDANNIKKQLCKQMVSPVRWEQTLQKLYSRPPGNPFPRSFDVGSEGMLKSVLKLINAKASDHCLVV